MRNLLDNISARAAMVGGAAFLAGGVTEIVHSQRNAGSNVVGVAGYLTLSFFVVALLGIAPSFPALARTVRSRAGRRGAAAAAAGTAVLGLTSISSLVNGHDLGLFNVVAPLTNGAWLFGAIALAVALRRARAVPGIVAFGLPIAWIASIPLATVGGGVISGAYYLAVGYLLDNQALAGPAAAGAPQPARA